MFKTTLYNLVIFVSKIHNIICDWNSSAYGLTDKQLHFLVIGVLGMLLFAFVQPIFRHLAEKGHITVVSWIYVFTVVLVLTFSIEIGQKITNTGAMEFEDIVFGALGFVFLFALFLLFRAIYRILRHFIKKHSDKKSI